ncbi:MAG: dephospho-CoA kinase [Syntrophobacterales bacterium]|nr:dephospho-CoA kinase [Syntrophobacterales bacterium]HNQ02420.1 dephospho-CoA kinase [Syntrophales bacterium]
MLNVGLTGGIATGKSTVVRMLVRRGARVIDHDALVHALQEPGRPVWRQIVEVFGRGILDDGGRIDRKRLGALVFGDEVRRKALEGIVHPAVLEEAERERERIGRQDGRAIVLSDIPLLLEVGMQDRFDLILLVYAPPEVQIERVMKRNGMTREEAAARLSAQMPIDEKLRRADVVIRNDSTMGDLEKRVDEVWQELLARERQKRA